MENINEFIETTFQNRFTCKQYDPTRTVSDADFHTIIEAGRLSPSSNGFEPWHFVLVRNRDVLEALKPVTWGAATQFEGASHVVLLLARTPDQMRPSSDYIRHIHHDIQQMPAEMFAGRMEKFETFQNQHLETAGAADRIYDWTVRQVYIALANMLTAAAMLGVDSTPVEGFDHAAAHKILSDLGVYDPATHRVAVMMCLGYNAKTPRPKTRRPLTDVLTTIE